MKKILIVLLGFMVSVGVAKAMDEFDEGLTSFVNSANSLHEKKDPYLFYLDSDPDKKLTSFVERLTDLFAQGVISSCETESHRSHNRDVWPKNYTTEKNIALSLNNLNLVSLEVKYNCVRDIYESFNEHKHRVGFLCTPELIAEVILASFPSTRFTDDATIQGAMHAFLHYIYPKTTNARFIVNEKWAPYALRQARNAELNTQLRLKFANLYPKCSSQKDKETFAQKLRNEICPERYPLVNKAKLSLENKKPESESKKEESADIPSVKTKDSESESTVIIESSLTTSSLDNEDPKEELPLEIKDPESEVDQTRTDPSTPRSNDLPFEFKLNDDNQTVSSTKTEDLESEPFLKPENNTTSYQNLFRRNITPPFEDAQEPKNEETQERGTLGTQEKNTYEWLSDMYAHYTEGFFSLFKSAH